MKNQIHYTIGMGELSKALRTQCPSDLNDCDIQTVMRDCATLMDMQAAEYAENGCYVSNIADLVNEYKATIRRRFETGI